MDIKTSIFTVKITRITLLVFFLVFQTALVSAQEIVNLSGEWQFKLDPDNKGIDAEWFKKPTFSESLRLPGCLQEQGYGAIPNTDTQWYGDFDMHGWFDKRPWMKEYRKASNFKTQKWLVPDRYYLGAAWYALEIDVPSTWKKKHVQLFLERCHWETQLWVDGDFQGKAQSLATPHIYELSGLEPGKHRLVLRVDNSEIVHLGGSAHSVSDQTAGTWNGIVGKIELRAESPIWLKNVQLYPDIENKLVHVKGSIEHLDSNQNGTWKMDVDVSGVSSKNGHHPERIQVEGQLKEKGSTTFAFEFPMGEGMKLWDEFDPNLYAMELHLQVDTEKGKMENTVKQRFGMRSFAKSGRKFTMNGLETFLRGNVDCAVYPKTGYAPMDVKSWRKIWQTYKDFGLNMARFHSWCPPEAAFIAADEMGIYLAPEVGEWSWISKPNQKEFCETESQSILDTYGNYAGFIAMGLGNESGGDKDFFKNFIAQWKENDPRHLYTIKANSGHNPDNIDYEVLLHTKDSLHRIRYQMGWRPLPMRTEFQAKAPNTAINWEKGVNLRDIPLIQHETGQIASYPNIMDEMAKYTGYLNPTYLEVAVEQLRERGMLDQLPDFVEASEKWQIELTKEEFEAGLRTKGLAGFNWLCLADFTGQSTAPVGLTDAFYDPKAYVEPSKVREWNAPTVLLASMPKRIYAPKEDFKADVLVSHYGKTNINLNITATLKKEDGTMVKFWELPRQEITQGSAYKLGGITTSLEEIRNPTHLILELASPEHNLHNQWDIWVFPKIMAEKIPKSVVVAKAWNDKLEAELKKGKTVLLLPQKDNLNGRLPICFTNYYWTSFEANNGQSSAAGVLINNQHEVFKDFPTQRHSNWQWWDILTNAHPMILDSYDYKNPWPKDYRPIIQPIDTWKINRKLSLLTEAKVGNGKLVICSIDIENDLENRPVTKQFRQNLFGYLLSDNFDPKTEVSLETVREVFDIGNLNE